MRKKYICERSKMTDDWAEFFTNPIDREQTTNFRRLKKKEEIWQIFYGLLKTWSVLISFTELMAQLKEVIETPFRSMEQVMGKKTSFSFAFALLTNYTIETRTRRRCREGASCMAQWANPSILPLGVRVQNFWHEQQKVVGTSAKVSYSLDVN